MTFSITKMYCFPLNSCTGWVLWEQSFATAHLSFKLLSAWAWRRSAPHAVHKNPHQAEGYVCLLIYNTETPSAPIGTPQWDARAVSRFSAWLWKQHPGGQRSETAQKCDLNAALHNSGAQESLACWVCTVKSCDSPKSMLEVGHGEQIWSR